MRKATLRVFIGSSRESLPIVRALERVLRKNRFLEVTPWDKMKLKPGMHLLDSLIEASATYDAAVLVFGADDLVISRGRKQKMPRDNVVFELGLFMAHLDRERAIVVAPNAWESNLKVLSNIQNLNPITYSPPRRMKALTARQKSVRLSNAVRNASETLNAYLSELKPREMIHEPISFGVVRRDLIDAQAVRSIRNIALDMEQTWPMLRDDILENDSITNVSIESLMIDGHSPQIARMSSATVSVRTAREQERNIVAYCTKHEKQLKARRIRFTCSAYPDIPVIHGFLVNDRKLMISVCSVEGGKLVGSPNPYLPFVTVHHGSRDKTALYLFHTFNAWFDFRQKHARLIWRNP